MVHPTIRPTLTVHVHVPIQRGMSISKLCVNTVLSLGIVVFLRCIRRMRNLGAYEWYFVLYGMSCVSEKGSYSPFPLSWNDAVGSGNGWWHRWESTSLSSTLWYLDIQRCTILVTHIYIFFLSYVVRGVSTLCSRRALWATILIVSRWVYLVLYIPTRVKSACTSSHLLYRTLTLHSFSTTSRPPWLRLVCSARVYSGMGQNVSAFERM